MGAEAYDLGGEAQGAGLAHPGGERLLGKPNSSLPVQPPVSCLLYHKYETNWCVGLVDFFFCCCSCVLWCFSLVIYVVVLHHIYLNGSTKIVFVTSLNRNMSLSLLSIKFYFLFAVRLK